MKKKAMETQRDDTGRGTGGRNAVRGTNDLPGKATNRSERQTINDGVGNETDAMVNAEKGAQNAAARRDRRDRIARKIPNNETGC